MLVNGRRHVGGDILNNAVSADINTFPTDLIDHIDVVTGGDSAIYGSDAISGVVNFVLKRDFQGLQLRGQGGRSAYNVRAAYDFSSSTNVYFGIDNLANKEPPLGLTGTTAGGGIYDVQGRFYYAGAKMKF